MRGVGVLMAAMLGLGCGGPTEGSIDGAAGAGDLAGGQEACQHDFDCGVSNGDRCVAGSACVEGTCTWRPPVSCEHLAGAPCQVGVCLPSTGECYLTAATEGSPCAVVECSQSAGTCVAGMCRPTGAEGCDDGNPCTEDLCLTGSGCQNPPLAPETPCVSADPCLDGATCTDGACGGGYPRSCDDGNTCTDDSCLPGIGCRSAPVPSYQKKPCEDGNTCAGPDYCKGGSCQSEWYNKNEGKACDDDDPCSISSTCKGGICRVDLFDGVPHALPAGNPCPIPIEDDRCWDRGECNAKGTCIPIAKPYGTECPDGCGFAPYSGPGKCRDGWCKCF